MNTNELIAVLDQRLKDERLELEAEEQRIKIRRIQFDNKIKSIEECSASHKITLEKEQDGTPITGDGSADGSYCSDA